jgi:hypothetical protein
MLHKTTNRLFHGKYQYKLVLICAGAQAFRSGNMDTALIALKKMEDTPVSEMLRRQLGLPIQKTPLDLTYTYTLQKRLAKLTDFAIRVESPWISVYTNSKKDVDTLVKLGESCVKYISSPPVSIVLAENTIVMSKRDYDYRITLGRTIQAHDAFVLWAEANHSKLKLTKSCKTELLKAKSWGGTHFYLTGDNVLLMAKMHLGGSIARIERIVKK